MLLFVNFCTWAFGYPAADNTEATWASEADLTNAVWIRVPDLNEMPKFSPLPPIASAPIKRIVPDSEKNHFDAPMKSNVQPRPRRAAPSIAGWETTRERDIA